MLKRFRMFTMRRDFQGKFLHSHNFEIFKLISHVDRRGLEPLTSAMRMQRSTN